MYFGIPTFIIYKAPRSKSVVKELYNINLLLSISFVGCCIKTFGFKNHFSVAHNEFDHESNPL